VDKNEAKQADNRLRYRRVVDGLIERLGGKCAKCESTENLEFDHIDWRTKTFLITTNWYIEDRVLFEAELAKCQLLCHPCHKTKTIQDLSEQEREEFTHGTVYAWMKRKCDCDECGVAKRSWYDQRNAKRRSGSEAAAPYNQPAEHGTYKRYKRGCKCDECRSANARKAAEAYALKRAEAEAA
jgi:hypothetical protein